MIEGRKYQGKSIKSTIESNHLNKMNFFKDNV